MTKTQTKMCTLTFEDRLNTSRQPTFMKLSNKKTYCQYSQS